jgi:DNA mismatch repair protein MutS2
MKNEHTMRLLDFHKVVESVSGYCLSEEGKALVLASLPSAEPATVASLKAEAFALVQAFDRDVEPLAFTFPPLDPALRVLSKEGLVLELEDLYALGTWAECYGQLTRFFSRNGGPGSKQRADEAPDVQELARVAFSILLKDGKLRDLPSLREIKGRIRSLHSDIERATQALFRDDAIRAALQSNEPTVRDGRTVVAVRSNFKGRVRGIVHEVSQTGQTVFIEPEEIVLKNNELVQEEARYAAELFRILSEATIKLRPSLESLERARACCADLDFAYARGRHARLTQGCFAEESQGSVTIYHARHPSLGSRAVPIDFPMPEDARVVIITGPNTGGKTVTLKTIGLLAMMNQFGLAVPAVEGTALAIFDEVFADIGDEQSIDQSLSTFSGHMRVMSDIVSRATGRSLVLLDELGSGTDPEEGCAIAMAILDRFIDRGATTVLTTHHGILKNYGYTRGGVLNASVDFDSRTLSPTYKIVMGVPGESHAIDVASRNGLPVDLVDAARGYLADERADVSALIRGLSSKHKELEELETVRKRALREAVERERKNDLKALSLKQKEAELREHGIVELKRMLSESRKSLENLVCQLREGELTREKTLKVKEYLAQLQDVVAREEAAFKIEFEEIEEPSGEFQEGDDVLVGKFKRKGKLIRKQKDGRWLVETDSVRLTAVESELTMSRAQAESKAHVAIELASPVSGRGLLSMDMRGMRLHEAMSALEAQIDNAIIAGIHSFEIIHGTGEGVLSTNVHDFLKRCRNVADYYFARPEEGGHGKTIVALK